MTVVIAWQESERLWLVSDSRLSAKGQTGHLVLTDHGAKVLEIPICLFGKGPVGFFDAPAIQTTFGLAYAGSSLIALQAYAAVGPLWSRLATTGPEELPPLQEFGQHLSKFLEAYAKEVGASGGDPRCECLLMGWDYSLSAPAAVVIETSAHDGAASVRLACFADGALEILGSEKDVVRQQIAELPPSPYFPHETPSRVPLRYIRSTLKSTDRLDIGGGVQIGMTNKNGFELTFDAQPIEMGSPFPDMRYRGFEMSEIGTLGQAFITLRGIA